MAWILEAIGLRGIMTILSLIMGGIMIYYTYKSLKAINYQVQQQAPAIGTAFGVMASMFQLMPIMLMMMFMFNMMSMMFRAFR